MFLHPHRLKPVESKLFLVVLPSAHARFRSTGLEPQSAVRLCLHTGESHVEVGIPECVIVRYLCVCSHVHKVSRECSNALTFTGNFLVFLFFCFFRKELCNLYVPPPAPVETG